MITKHLIETINDLVYMIENRTLTAQEKKELETKSLQELEELKHTLMVSQMPDIELLY
jgi:uncharacterized protein YnzC (UPF0291/DUF896 family)